MRWYQRLVGCDHSRPLSVEELSPEEIAFRPFIQRESFLSKDEIHLLRVLNKAVGDHALVCPKVRVADVLAVVNAAANMEDAIAIDRKSIGFLLCDLAAMQPIAAVSILQGGELLQQRLTGKVEQAFCAAGIPVIFVSPQECSVEDLRAQLLPLLGEQVDQELDALPASSTEEQAQTRPQSDAGRRGRRRSTPVAPYSNAPNARGTVSGSVAGVV